MSKEPKKWDIFRYTFKAEESRHCKHGILIAHHKKDGEWWLNDTYWSKFKSYGDYGWYKWSDIKSRVQRFGNVKQLKEIGQRESAHYEVDDVLYVPIGGGLEAWYKKRSAKLNKDYVTGQLHEEINSLKSDIDYKIREIVCKEIELKKIISKSYE